MLEIRDNTSFRDSRQSNRIDDIYREVYEKLNTISPNNMNLTSNWTSIEDVFFQNKYFKSMNMRTISTLIYNEV
jgi:hypothetical protein